MTPHGDHEVTSVPAEVSDLLPGLTEQLLVSAADLGRLIEVGLREWGIREKRAELIVSDLVRAFRRMHSRRVESHGLVRMSDVPPEEIRWLWPGRIPLGRLSIIEGDPGLGKSTVTMDLAARVTTGSPMPTQRTAALEPRGVVLLTAEDGLADTVRPRLDAAGADSHRVVTFRAEMARSEARGHADLRLPTVQDIDRLEVAIRNVEAALLIVDPLSAFLGPGVDAHRDADVRAGLIGLASLADRMGVAVLAVRHLRKSGGANPIYAGGGSIALIAAARAAHLLARDPQDERRLILAPVKNNLAAQSRSLALRIVPGASSGTRVSWEGATDHKASELLKPEGEEARSAREEARDMLLTELEQGSVPADTLRARARELGIGWRTVQRAKKDLKIQSEKHSFGAGSKWMWFLPGVPRQAPGGLKPAKDLAPLGTTVEPQETPSPESLEDRQRVAPGALSNGYGNQGHDDPSRCADCGREVEFSPAHSVQRCFPCGVRAGRREQDSRPPR